MPTKFGGIDGPFGVGLVTNWVTSAVDFGKKLLFLLNGCYSTQFARAAFKEATMEFSRVEDDDDDGAQDRLRSSVGFLTSGSEAGCPSTILVSKEEDLVYLFDENQKERRQQSWHEKLSQSRHQN
jgi:hypothetical protein